MGDITLQYITNPDRLREKIEDLVKDHVESYLIAEKAIQIVAEKVIEDGSAAQILSGAPIPETPESIIQQKSDDED